MSVHCPHCARKTISSAALMGSVVGIHNPKCSRCGKLLTVTDTWKNLFNVPLILGLIVAIPISIHDKNFLPLFALTIFCFFSTVILSVFGKLRVREPFSISMPKPHHWPVITGFITLIVLGGVALFLTTEEDGSPNEHVKSLVRLLLKLLAAVA